MSQLMQHPGKEKLEKYAGQLTDQINAFKDGLDANRLPDKVLLILREPEGSVLNGIESFASLTIADGTKHFILDARTLRHQAEGFRYWYEVSVAKDGAIEVQVFRVPDDRKPVPPDPAPECWF